MERKGKLKESPVVEATATLVSPIQRRALEEQPDEVLVSLAAEGDRAAFRCLVEKYEGEVSATVGAMLGPSADVDDTVQEVFIRFFHSLNRFRGEAKVTTYLKRIAINRSLDILRRRKRVLSRFISRDDESHYLVEPVHDENASVVERERAVLVHRAVQALPSKHRAVIVLRLLEGYSTEETSEILDIPYGTVLSRLSRAQAKLKAALAPLIT
jgi:RNA polymerase sigma-70 factor (ECF subfamily)